MVVENFPEALDTFDDRGYLPLHAACAAENTLELIEFFLDKVKTAVLPKTRNGDLPLFLAASAGYRRDNCAHLDALLLLVRSSVELFTGHSRLCRQRIRPDRR